MYKESNLDIRDRMLNKVPNDLDKSEGSFFYDVFSPVSEEFAKVDSELDKLLSRMFIKTALENNYDKEIEMRASENGIYRKSGTCAIGKVTFIGINDTFIPKGTIVQTQSGLQFKTLEDEVIKDEKVDANIQAMETGSSYLVSTNTICEIPIQILGITDVKNENPTKAGLDEESIESLSKRYFEKIQNPITSGNINHYKQWAMEVQEVGDVRVFPLWNGNGTLKIAIVDNNKRKPTETLIKKVYKHIEQKRPIGAQIEIVGCTEKVIDICGKVKLANGFNIGQIYQQFTKFIDEYLKSIVFKISYISIAKVGSILLNIPGVLDYSELKINNTNKNIGLENEEVPLLGDVLLEVQ